MGEESLLPKEKAVYDALKNVIDPELGVSLVDLGLIYSVEVDDQNVCHINWTLTTMGCPIIELLQDMIKKAALQVDGVEKCEAKLVYYPQWIPKMMSQVARLTLGIHI